MRFQVDDLSPETQQRMTRELYDAGYYVAGYGGDGRARLYRVADHRAWREAGQPQWWFTHLEALRFGHARFVTRITSQ